VFLWPDMGRVTREWGHDNMKKKTENITVYRRYTEKGQKHDHVVHMNDNYELYMLLQGEASISIDGQMYPVKPYDILMITNKEIHRVFVNEAYEYERIYIYFNADYFRQFSSRECNLLSAFDHRIGGVGNKIPHDIVKKYSIDEDLIRMHNLSKSELPERKVLMTSIFLKMLVSVKQAHNESVTDVPGKDDNPNYNEKINEVIRYISENLNDKISLDELASQFYLSKYYLCHEFKRITGFSVFDYIRYKKMLEAKMRLQTGQPINEVWCELGYEDYSNFYRNFKKATGISPKEYVEKLKTNEIAGITI